MKNYQAPEFDVTAYEVEDIITVSIANDGNFHDDDNGWTEIVW